MSEILHNDEEIKSGSSGQGSKGATTRSASGTSGDALALALLTTMAGFDLSKYIHNGAVQINEARKDAQQRMLDGIEGYLKKECYLVGNYLGVTPSGSPDKQGMYDFEVESCLIDVDYMMNAAGTTYEYAMNGYQYRIARQLELSLKFKTIDATSYLTIPSAPMLANMSLNVVIERNTTGAAEGQQQGMQRIAEAIINALHNATIFKTPVLTATSSAGAGPISFLKVN